MAAVVHPVVVSNTNIVSITISCWYNRMYRHITADRVIRGGELSFITSHGCGIIT